MLLYKFQSCPMITSSVNTFLVVEQSANICDVIEHQYSVLTSPFSDVQSTTWLIQNDWRWVLKCRVDGMWNLASVRQRRIQYKYSMILAVAYKDMATFLHGQTMWTAHLSHSRAWLVTVAVLHFRLLTQWIHRVLQDLADWLTANMSLLSSTACQRWKLSDISVISDPVGMYSWTLLKSSIAMKMFRALLTESPRGLVTVHVIFVRAPAMDKSILCTRWVEQSAMYR